ncbi:MAG: preprotein translocase subunit SecY [Firmicutes bacterium]|nr:preprotein translocase subunit SecY [Bacillota bacterium]
MFQTLINAFRVKEIRKKMLFTLFLIFVFILCCFVPIPGIDVNAMRRTVETTDGTVSFLGLLNGVSGGAFKNGTLFALGISPYINASIIMQLLSVAIPPLQRLQKQGEDGRKKIAQYTRILTLILAIVQALGICFGYSEIIDRTLFNNTDLTWLVYIVVCIMLCSGTMLAMWIGERITEKGVSNGISMLIFTGILMTAGTAIIGTISNIVNGIGDSTVQTWGLIGFLIAVIIIFALIVFVDLAERRISVQYAKQIKGRKMYGGQNTHIPIKVNASGVLPLIFAFALLSFPSLIATVVDPKGGFTTWWSNNMVGGGGGPWHAIVLSLLILFFAFFYGQIQFNPEDVSRNIQQYGGFIPGIRPGKPTTDYLKKINNRITFFGAIFLAFIALVPTIIFSTIVGQGSLLNAFSTTGLLIVVSVALEFNKQLEGQLMMKHYKGFLD